MASFLLRKKKAFKIISLSVACMCFFQFSGLVSFAYAARIEHNTLKLKKEKVALAEIAQMKPAPKSELGRKILAG